MATHSTFREARTPTPKREGLLKRVETLAASYPTTINPPVIAAVIGATAIVIAGLMALISNR